MRIELPLPTWNDAARVQDDAHTLTLPAPRGVLLDEPACGAAEQGMTQRTEIAGRPPRILTLTF